MPRNDQGSPLKPVQSASLRFTLGALLFFAAAPSLLADSLSKQEIIQLQTAAIDSQTIVTKVKKDGINFAVTAAVMIELKNLGFSPEVIRALVDAERPAASSNIQGEAQTLYHDGKYPELIQKLQAHLTQEPADSKSRALLALSFLRLNEVDLAEKEAGKLRATDASSTYIQPVEEVLKRGRERQVQRAALLEAFKESRRRDIPTLIDSLDAPPLQKAILHVYLSMYEADFDAADKSLSSISVSSYVDTLRLRTLKTAVTDAKKQYDGLVRKIEVYLHSPLAPSQCILHHYPDFINLSPGLSALSIDEYTSLVSNLLQTAPLSDLSMDLGVHLAMIRSAYSDFERFADQILKIKGNISIPGYGDREYFYLVLDSEKRRIFTKPDKREFLVKYAIRRSVAFPGRESIASQITISPSVSTLVPFDLPFSTIQGIAQSAASQNKSYALKFAPGGLVPNYALEDFVACKGGLEAQLTATRNLGQFVLHLIGPTQIPVKLENPERPVAGGGWQVAALAAAYGGVMAQRGDIAAANLASHVVAEIQEDQARRLVMEAAQERTWYATAMRETFSFQDDRSFAEMEKLIGLIQ